MNPPDRRKPGWTATITRWAPPVGLLAGTLVLLNRTRPESAAFTHATSEPPSGRPASPRGTPEAPDPPPGSTVASDSSGRGQHATPPSTGARKAGHETSDMNARTMAFLSVGLLVAAGIVMGGMTLLNRLLRTASEAERPGLTAEQTADIPPPAPNLQTDAPADIVRLRKGQDTLLDTYAWIDADHTRARIPIDRAMALTIGRKLDTAP